MERSRSDIRTQADTQTDLLITENIGLVYYSVNKFNIPDAEFDDLISIGSIGLIKATKTYDNSKNVRFSTYALKCINNEIIACHIRRVKKWKNIAYLDAPLYEDEYGNIQTLSETLPDERANHEMQIMDRFELAGAFQRIFNSLDLRSLTVFLAETVGWPQNYSVEQFGLSQSYVSRIAKKAKMDLRQYTKYNGEWQVFYNSGVLSIHRTNHFLVQFSIDDNLLDNLVAWLFEIYSASKQSIASVSA